MSRSDAEAIIEPNERDAFVGGTGDQSASVSSTSRLARCAQALKTKRVVGLLLVVLSGLFVVALFGKRPVDQPKDNDAEEILLPKNSDNVPVIQEGLAEWDQAAGGDSSPIDSEPNEGPEIQDGKSVPVSNFVESNLSVADKDATYAIDTAGNMNHLDAWERECRIKREQFKSDESMKKIIEADCGGGYKRPEPTDKSTKVGLIGDWNPSIYSLSGCALGFSCPWSPKCEFVRADPDHAQHIDVLLTVVFSYPRIRVARKAPGTISVLYWREALWGEHPSPRVQLNDFDLEMGVHHFAALNNPNFIRPPSFLLKGVYQDSPKHHFAASVISDCSAHSLREIYLHMLSAALGPERVHRYGKCGNRKFPPKPIIHGLKLLAQYKFYFAFENTIQTGYTTEKLFSVLLLPVIPVYYGDPFAPNVTKTPSYIKASDFNSAESLAKYLLYLDKNPAAYNAYHTWRNDVHSMRDDYLDKVKELPGPEERKAHAMHPLWMADRRALCCRLCDEPYLRRKMRERGGNVVNFTMSRTEIAQFFFKRSNRLPLGGGT